LRRLVTAAGPEFKARQIIEIDLPEGGHLQKVVGRRFARRWLRAGRSRICKARREKNEESPGC
jgi:hypothetical protein